MLPNELYQDLLIGRKLPTKNISSSYDFEASVPIEPQIEQQEQAETNVMPTVQEIKRLFLKDSRIVWFDSEVYTAERQKYVPALQEIRELKVFYKWEQAREFLDKATAFYHVITTETNGQLLVDHIATKTNVISIHVFCDAPTSLSQWTKNYKKIVSVESNFEAIISSINQQFLKWQRLKSSLKLDFPAFSPLFSDDDKTQNNYLNFYLQGLTKIGDRSQSKADFLSLAREIYKNKEDIDEFENIYADYNQEQILKWYTKDSFFFKLTNTCLRVAKSESIQCCRLIIADLEAAIKEQYSKKSKNFSGLLYRGAYILNEEWDKLTQNKGKDIEMYGFFSTTKNKDVAISFCQEDRSLKALITIIVPAIPDQETQGLAEVKEFSVYPDEDEVLFNLRSRFIVLETGSEEIDGEKYRSLILLYGAERIRKFVRLNSPTIEVKVEVGQQIKCKVCEIGAQNDDAKQLFFIDIMDSSKIFCSTCTKDAQGLDSSVLVNMPSLIDSNSFDVSPTHKSLKIGGIITKYEKGLKLPFYGQKCSHCQNEELKSRIVCSSCQALKKEWCNKCFEAETECINSGHIMIYEHDPFTFWNEKMLEDEFSYLNYRSQPLEQGQVFLNTHEYIKAKQYYEKRISQHKKQDKFVLLVDSINLGSIYNYLGEIDKAMDWTSQALEICISLYGDKPNSYTATCYNNLGKLYAESGRFEEARKYYSNALEISKALTGDKNHPNVAMCCQNLGYLSAQLGHFDKAIEYDLEAIEIYKKLYGDKHLETASAYDHFGIVNFELNNLDKALEYCLKAFEVRRSICGSKDPHTATSYLNLGRIYFMLRNFKKCIGYYTNSLEIRKTVFGIKHPLTAVSYNHLGLAYCQLGQFDKSLECHTHALETRKSVYGMHNADTATSYGNIGMVYYQLEELEKSLKYYNEGLRIIESLYGTKHRDVASFYNSLGSVLFALGKLEEAKTYCLKALEIWESIYGTKHVKVAGCCSNIGGICNELGETENAMSYYEKSLEVSKDVYGQVHDTVAACYNGIGFLHFRTGEFETAEKYYLDAIKIWKEIYGETHPDLAACYNKLGLVYTALGEFEKAVESHSNAVEISTSVYDYNHPELPVYHFDLGVANYNLEKFADAENCFLYTLEKWEPSYGNNHPQTASVYNFIGLIYHNIGKFEGAIEYFSKALEGLKAVFGEQHLNLVDPYENLEAAYDALGKTEKVFECQRMCEEIRKLHNQVLDTK